MSISLEDVRHIAALARLGLDDSDAEAMAVELSSILVHMQVLASVTGDSAAPEAAETDRAMPLRPDSGVPIALARPLSDIAPEFRDGFFLVPRLATHEDVEAAS